MSFTVKTTPILATGLTANTLSITPSAALTAGSTLVVIGGAVQNDTSDSALLNSVADNASNTWGTPENTRSASAYAPNGFAAVAQNVASGTPTITLTFNANASNRVSGVLYEVIGAPSSSALEVILKGIGTGAYTTATTASSTLSQADNLVIGCGSGWIGNPADTAGYTAVLDQTNGASGYLGAWVGHKTVATTAAVTYTQAHPDVATTGSNAMAVIIKQAAAGDSYKYKFKLRSDTFTSAVTSVNLLVWRNSGPTGVYAEEYTGLAGDAVAGDLVVSSAAIAAAYPGANVASTDTITGIAWVAGGNSTGIMTGAVEAE
jgi:hypothetical protein